MALEHDDGGGDAGGPQLLADFGAAHGGQAEVYQDQVRFGNESSFEAGFAVAFEDGAKTLLFQEDSDCVAKAVVIIDDKNCAHVQAHRNCSQGANACDACAC